MDVNILLISLAFFFVATDTLCDLLVKKRQHYRLVGFLQGGIGIIIVKEHISTFTGTNLLVYIAAFAVFMIIDKLIFGKIKGATYES